MVRLGLDDIERRLYGLGAGRAAGLLIEGAGEPARKPLRLYRPSFAVPVDVEVRDRRSYRRRGKARRPAPASAGYRLASAPWLQARRRSLRIEPRRGQRPEHRHVSVAHAMLSKARLSLFFKSESAARTSGANGALGSSFVRATRSVSGSISSTTSSTTSAMST